MKEPYVILASGSPRRREIVESLGIPFRVVTSGVSEDIEDGFSPEEIVRKLADRKAKAVAASLQEGLVIGSDTTIAFDGSVLGKPADAEEAIRMLQRLRGQEHEVLTAVAIVNVETGRTECGVETTRVVMRNYSDDEVKNYVDSGEPMDKAGSYAIQGKGGALVESIDGPLENVIGLPRDLLVELLAAFGVKLDGSKSRRPSN